MHHVVRIASPVGDAPESTLLVELGVLELHAPILLGEGIKRCAGKRAGEGDGRTGEGRPVGEIIVYRSLAQRASHRQQRGCREQTNL